MSEWDEITNKLEPVTWDEIKEFYKRNFNETLSEDWKEAFCFAWSKSRKMAVIDLLATGYQAAKDEYKTKISELEIELENWKHTAIHGDEGL